MANSVVQHEEMTLKSGSHGGPDLLIKYFLHGRMNNSKITSHIYLIL
jgi:hypothetical protein